MNTTYYLNLVMGNIFHTKADPGIPDEYYMGLSASEPTIDGVDTGEPSINGTGYERVKLSSLSAPENGVIKNASAIGFNESVTNWGVMRYYTVYDAKTGGNLLFYGPLTLSRTVEPNTVVTIKSGELTIQLSNPA